MPEFLTQLAAQPGLGWIALAAFASGLVRGFAGFGTAMIFLPVAAIWLSPVWALLVLIPMDIFGPLPAVPGAVRDAERKDLRRLILGMVLVLPLSLTVLVSMPEEVFRYGVSCLTLVLLVILISGVRLRRKLSPGGVFGVGAAGGFLGGVAGLPGPPVIFAYMAGPHPARVVRANTMLYLLAFDVALIVCLMVMGRAEATPMLLGIAMAIPSAIGAALGTAMFRPDKERFYRVVAYVIIATSAVMGLPFWGG